MFNKRQRRTSGPVNAGSMADIAFLLLIFFLVTTIILNEKGLMVQLPPWSDAPPQPLGDDRVYSVKLNGADELLVEGQAMAVTDLREAVKAFLLEHAGKKAAVIALQNDRSTSYAAYIGVYDQLKAAYRECWEQEARSRYGRSLAELSTVQEKQLKRWLPMVISESEPTDYVAAGQ